MAICICGLRFSFLFKTKKCGGLWFSGRLRYLYFWKEYDKPKFDCQNQLVNDDKTKAQFEACELFSKV